MSGLKRLPKLYKNPSTYFDSKRHESVSVVFHESEAGKEMTMSRSAIENLLEVKP